MHRRTFLWTALPAVVGLAGCTGAGGGGGSGGGGDGGGDDDDAPTRITDRSLQDTGRCESPETTSVSFDTGASKVSVSGCVTGPNGCAKASLGSATLDDGTLTVVVTTERDAPPGMACTEALVYRAYEATVTFDRGVPSSVTVVHDVPGGRQTVASESS